MERWATFDCYGTLVDWNGGIRRELARIFGEGEADRLLHRYHELEPELEADGQLTYRQVLTRALDRLAVEEGAELDDPAALADSLPSWQPFPEARASLEDVRARGWRLAILSNTDPDYIAASKELIGVPFEETIVASEIGSYKPAHGHWERVLPPDRRGPRGPRPCRGEPLPRHRARKRARAAECLDQPARRARGACQARP